MSKREDFDQALIRCQIYSAREQCSAYVNAICKVVEGTVDGPFVDRFEVSDWFVHGSTIARFDCGERREMP